MKKLIIHPRDRTTKFLSKAYENLDNVTVVTDGLSKDHVRGLVEEHDQVMMMGHGSPSGLFSVGQFYPTFNGCIVDGSFADLLAKKDNSIFIWCNADMFTEQHNLQGFYTGMFVSDTTEAYLTGLGCVGKDEIDESNNAFAKIVGEATANDLPMTFVFNEYGKLAERNAVAQYNHERLYVH